MPTKPTPSATQIPRLLTPRAVLAVLALAWLAGCASDGSADDGGGVADQRPPGDAAGEAPAQRSLDFVVGGCQARPDGGCSGPAPLVLTFTAVTVGVTETVEWDLGDGSPLATGDVVSHAYSRPGIYDVTLVTTVAGGTLSEQRAGFVVVEAAGPGARCVGDQGCASQSCICREGECPYPLATELCLFEECIKVGLCLSACEKVSCPAGTTCVDLGLGGGPDAGPWRTTLCMPTCSEALGCDRPGLKCRLAPTNSGWRPVCLPPFPRFVGEPCRDVSGEPDPGACIGGLCLDLGASGYCSASCDNDTCPEGTRCARLAGGEASGVAGAVCLLRCDNADQCVSDPMLACQAPDSAGLFGIEVEGPADPQGTEYCGVKRCGDPTECGIAGFCDGAAGGFCRLPTQ